MSVRMANTGDARQIAEIQVASAKVGYRGLLPDAHLDSLSVKQRTQDWTEKLAGYEWHTLVAEEEEVIRGWISYGKCRDADAPDAVELMGLYVDPAFFRGGTGRALWAGLMKRLVSERYQRLAVWVLKDNIRARRFYEAMGGRLDISLERKFECRGELLPEVRYWYSVKG